MIPARRGRERERTVTARGAPPRHRAPPPRPLEERGGRGPAIASMLRL
jgi:hypothetical protein